MLPQLVLARLMESGDLERHLRLMRRRHRRRRDAMINALRRELAEAQIHGAAAGLHLMITFDADFTDVDLAGAAFDRGVKVQPLSWHCQTPQPPGSGTGLCGHAGERNRAGHQLAGQLVSGPAKNDSAGNDQATAGCASRGVVAAAVVLRCQGRARSGRPARCPQLADWPRSRRATPHPGSANPRRGDDTPGKPILA